MLIRRIDLFELKRDPPMRWLSGEIREDNGLDIGRIWIKTIKFD